MSCSTQTRTDTLKTPISLPSWVFLKLTCNQRNPIHKAVMYISFIHTTALSVSQTQSAWHTCGLHTQHQVTLKDLQEDKQEFWRIFFCPSPSISKISDVVTLCESKTQHSIALWDQTFIKRKTLLSTRAKHTHKNQLAPACTQTQQKDEKKKQQWTKTKERQCSYPGKVHAKFELRDEMENYTTLVIHDS